jgi:hypothetical protein
MSIADEKLRREGIILDTGEHRLSGDDFGTLNVEFWADCRPIDRTTGLQPELSTVDVGFAVTKRVSLLDNPRLGMPHFQPGGREFESHRARQIINKLGLVAQASIYRSAQ